LLVVSWHREHEPQSLQNNRACLDRPPRSEATASALDGWDTNSDFEYGDDEFNLCMNIGLDPMDQLYTGEHY